MMRPLLLALLAFASSNATAQNTDALGTLFQTPQERASIDRARAGESGTVSSSYGALRPNPVITGYVKRSDGKHTVFVDNEPFDVKGANAEKLLQPRSVHSYIPVAPSRQATEADAAKTATDAKVAAPVPQSTAPKATPAK